MLFFVPIYAVLLIVHKGASVKVEVKQGWLAGEELELVTKDGHYYSFKGIPYAAPPIGNLRFKAPQPPQPWKGIKNATNHGSVCIQYNIFTNRKIHGSEDCLFLNVYTQNLNPKKLLPVMVFIHGGGFESDSGNTDNYGPDYLVQNGVVLVTLNYRLEVLGFLSLDTEEVPGNAGMKDQVAALKWVKEHIREFGGDPDNVTLFGQSAGSVSAIMHMLSSMSKNLFKRVIAMSGVPSCDWAIAYQPRRRAFALGKQLGIDTKDDKELYTFLKNVSSDTLVNVNPSVLSSEEKWGNVLKMFHFTPVVEKDFGQERFLAESPEKIIKDGKINKADLIIGHMSEEGIGDLVLFEDSLLKDYSEYPELLVPREILINSKPNDILNIADMIHNHYFGTKSIDKNTFREFLTYINDSTYNYDIYRYIKMLSQLNKIYVYRFSGVSKRNIFGKIGEKYNFTVAGHSDDTAYLFEPVQAKLESDKNSKEYKMIQQTTKLFTNFAKFGNPTPDESLGVSWAAYNNTTEIFMDIGETLIIGKALNADVVEFWKSVFNKAGLDF